MSWSLIYNSVNFVFPLSLFVFEIRRRDYASRDCDSVNRVFLYLRIVFFVKLGHFVGRSGASRESIRRACKEGRKNCKSISVLIDPE